MVTTRCRASIAVPADATLATSVPGGWATRPAERIYTPTYWAAVGWASVGGWAIALRQSTGVRMDRAGALELMVARDAREETCELNGGTGVVRIVLSPLLPHVSLVATDLVERDGAALPPCDVVELDPSTGSIATVRLLP